MLLVRSKFAAGNQPGGEFFDIISNNNTLTLFLSRCRCYKSSGIILSLFKEFKFSDEAENIDTLIDGIVAKLTHHDVDNNRVDVMVFNIDLTTLRVRGINFRDHEMVSTLGRRVSPNEFSLKTTPIDKASFDFSLERGERIAFLSSGLKDNYESTADKDGFVSLALRLIHEEKKPFCDEIFSTLKEDKNERFLKCDASCITIEVDKNAIFKV